MRRLLCGKPVILVENGTICQRNLARTRIHLDELTEHLREQGILVRDCASFGLSPRHLRVGVRTPAENLRLIQALWPSEPA